VKNCRTDFVLFFLVLISIHLGRKTTAKEKRKQRYSCKKERNPWFFGIVPFEDAIIGTIQGKG
jgi:hypothetical protein